MMPLILRPAFLLTRCLVVLACWVQLMGVGCAPDPNRELKRDGCRISYISPKIQNNAQALLDYLVGTGYCSGPAKTLRLERSSDVLQIRMLVEEGSEREPKALETAQTLSHELSVQVLSGEGVDVLLCGADMICHRAATGVTLSAPVHKDKCIVYQRGRVGTDMAKSTLEFLALQGFCSDQRRVLALNEEANVYSLRIATDKSTYDDEKKEDKFRMLAAGLSATVLDGQPLQIHFTDAALRTQHQIDGFHFGRLVQAKGCRLFYEAPVPKQEARLLLDFMVKESFCAAGESRSVQITKSDAGYVFKLVVVEARRDFREMVPALRGLAAEIAGHVFEGSHVDIHLCNGRFETVKTIEGLNYGKVLTRNGCEIYYPAPEDAQRATRLLNHLVNVSFCDGEEKVLQLRQSQNRLEVRLVLNRAWEQRPDLADTVKGLGRAISDDVFQGAAIDMHLCDETFSTRGVVSIPPQETISPTAHNPTL